MAGHSADGDSVALALTYLVVDLADVLGRPGGVVTVADDLLVLDNYGLLPLSPQAAQDLYQILSERYEHGSMIVTGNRAFEEWAEVFGDNQLAGAALDRLTPHAHTFVMRGASYRQRTHTKGSANYPTATSPEQPPRVTSQQTT